MTPSFMHVKLDWMKIENEYIDRKEPTAKKIKPQKAVVEWLDGNDFLIDGKWISSSFNILTEY